MESSSSGAVSSERNSRRPAGDDVGLENARCASRATACGSDLYLEGKSLDSGICDRDVRGLCLGMVWPGVLIGEGVSISGCGVAAKKRRSQAAFGRGLNYFGQWWRRGRGRGRWCRRWRERGREKAVGLGRFSWLLCRLYSDLILHAYYLIATFG